MMLVSRGKVTAHGALEGGQNLVPGQMAVVDEGLGRWAGHLPLLSQNEWRLVTIDTLGRGETRGGTGEGVMGILHPQELLGSGG